MPLTIERDGKAAAPEERPYMAYGAAWELMRATQREVLIAGPSGTGKSRAALEKLNLICMQLPVRAGIVRKVRKSITQSAMVTFETKVLPSPTTVKFHEGDQEYRYPNGARIMVSGLDDAEKLKSTEFDIVYVQEATELEEDDWGLLLRGLRNGVLPYQQVIADCNPGPPDHWLKVRADSGSLRLIESSHADNPELFDRSANDWTPRGVEYMATLDSLRGVLYQRLRLGLWVAAQGMYFTEWDPRAHICPRFAIPAEWPRWIAVDYGFAAPFCCLWLARCPETRRIYVYDEAYLPGLRDEQQAELILERTGEDRLNLKVLDPSMFNIRAEQRRPSIAQVYVDCGLGPVYPGMNSRKQGWAIVRRALASDPGEGLGDGDSGAAEPGLAMVRPRLQILEGKAPNLCREMPALVMDQLDPEDVADVVRGQKISDHAADALRYGLCAEAQPDVSRAPRQMRWG